MIINADSNLVAAITETNYTNFRYKGITLFVFSLYIFWGTFGIDLTLHPDIARVPLHRGFILLTAFIFFFNVQQVLNVCSKNKLLITLIAYTLLTAAWSSDAAETTKNFIFLSSTLFISIMTALAYTDKQTILIKKLFWLFLLMAIASLITAVLFPQVGINSNTFGNKPRWIGITTHPNALGVLGLVLNWLATNLYFLTKNRFNKLFILFAIALSFYLLIMADSMTSLLTSIIIIAYIIYYYLLSRVNKSIKAIFFIFAGIAFLITITIYMNFSELINLMLSSTGRNTTFTGRALLWQRAFMAIGKNIIFGYGFDSLGQLSKMYHLGMSHLHNGYIETLVKGGLVSSTLLLIILFKTYYQQLKIKITNNPDFIFLNSGLIMILFHNVTESSMLRGLSTLSIFLIFIIVATSLINKKNNNQTI